MWAEHVARTCTYFRSERPMKRDYSEDVIAIFRRGLDENCALLGGYTANSGSFLPTFRGNLSVPYRQVVPKRR
jgi:hypothetical protein